MNSAINMNSYRKHMTTQHWPTSGKCFPRIKSGKHFPYVKLNIFLWPELNFFWLTFHVFAKHRKVRKMVSRKVNSWKQTWPKRLDRLLIFPLILYNFRNLSCQTIRTDVSVNTGLKFWLLKDGVKYLMKRRYFGCLELISKKIWIFFILN